MRVKIFCKEIEKINRFFVETSNHNMRAGMEMQLAQAELADESETNKAGTDDFDVVRNLKTTLNYFQQEVDFISDVLHLDEKQKGRLDRMDSDKTTQLAVKITLKLQGLSDKEVADAFNGDTSGRVVPAVQVFELKNKLVEMDLTEKATLVNLHWSTKDFDAEDFYTLNRILSVDDSDRLADPDQLG